jgi:hypothetical protein
MEAGDMDGAGTLASEARAEAARLRHAFYEARAEWILRSAAYRSGREGEPDLELVEAVRDLRQPNVEAMVCLNEAAIAWRLGDRATASRLADAASVSWNSTGRWWFSLLARSLSIRARGAAQPGEVSAILARIPACRLPGVVLQVFGLVAPLGIAGESVSVGLAEEAAASLRGRDPGLRREVLSVQEALDFVRGGSAS